MLLWIRTRPYGLASSLEICKLTLWFPQSCHLFVKGARYFLSTCSVAYLATLIYAGVIFHRHRYSKKKVLAASLANGSRPQMAPNDIETSLPPSASLPAYPSSRSQSEAVKILPSSRMDNHAMVKSNAKSIQMPRQSESVGTNVYLLPVNSRKQLPCHALPPPARRTRSPYVKQVAPMAGREIFELPAMRSNWEIKRDCNGGHERYGDNFGELMA